MPALSGVKKPSLRTLLPSRQERGKECPPQRPGLYRPEGKMQGQEGESKSNLKGQLRRRLMELVSVDLRGQGEGRKIKIRSRVGKNLRLIPSLLWIPQ